MTALRQYVIHCDGPNCRDWIVAKVSTVTAARKHARKNGWRHRDGQDFCRAHRP